MAIMSRLLTLALALSFLAPRAGAEFYRCRIDHQVRRSCCCAPRAADRASGTAKGCGGCCDIIRESPDKVVIAKEVAPSTPIAPIVPLDAIPSASLPSQDAFHLAPSVVCARGPTPVYVRVCSLLI